MKYSKILIINLIVSCILAIFVTSILAYVGFFGKGLFDVLTQRRISAEAEMIIFFLVVDILCFVGVNIMCLPLYIIKLLGLAKDTINQKYVDTKESIYTRELPEYNSSVAGEIIDLKTTFEQEYIAGVIELVSKGYIIEKEDSLTVNISKPKEGLLRNEKYILETCTNLNTNLRFINTYEFYKELKQDMYELGLYKKGIFLKKLRNKIRYYIEKDEKGTLNNRHYIFIMMLPLLICMIMQNIILMIAIYLIILILIRKNKLTKNGELEKEKMSKLKLFLEKETDFKNKGEEERELWGRYSAFAVAFGLNKEMEKEIEKKLNKVRIENEKKEKIV